MTAGALLCYSSRDTNVPFPAAAVCHCGVAGGCANAIDCANSIDVVAETTITRNFTNALRLVIYFVLNTSLEIDALRRSIALRANVFGICQRLFPSSRKVRFSASSMVQAFLGPQDVVGVR